MESKDKQHGDRGGEPRGKRVQDDARESSRTQAPGKPRDSSSEPRPEQRMDDDGAPRAQPGRPGPGGDSARERETGTVKKPTYGDQEPDDPRRLETDAGDSKRARRESESDRGREVRD